MNKNSNVAKQLYDEISEILLRKWDPIGVKDISEAQDEYNSYVSLIYELLMSGKSEKEIFEYLLWIESERIELPINEQHTKNIARMLTSAFVLI